MAERRTYFPIMADITGARCIVVGGGVIGWRRTTSLLECGAAVVVIAPQAVLPLEAAAAEGKLQWVRREFQPDDLKGAVLAFAAADDPQVNRRVREEASRCGVWLNSADDGEVGNFVVPAAVRRGGLVMAVTTGGASPALARNIASEWKERYGAEYAAYVHLLKRLRVLIKASAADDAEKRGLLEEILQWNIPERLRAGERVDAIEEEVTKRVHIRLDATCSESADRKVENK